MLQAAPPRLPIPLPRRQACTFAAGGVPAGALAASLQVAPMMQRLLEVRRSAGLHRPAVVAVYSSL